MYGTVLRHCSRRTVRLRRDVQCLHSKQTDAHRDLLRFWSVCCMTLASKTFLLLPLLHMPKHTFVVLPKNLSGSFDSRPMGSSADRLVRSMAASTSSGVAPGASSTPKVAVTLTYKIRLSTCTGRFQPRRTTLPFFHRLAMPCCHEGQNLQITSDCSSARRSHNPDPSATLSLREMLSSSVCVHRYHQL